MVKIHPSSVVHPNAQIGEDVSIGPFCYVEEDVNIGDRTVLDSHVTLKRWTELGNDNFVGQGAVLGGEPQDKKFLEGKSFLKIGHGNVFREYVTISRASGELKSTVFGNENYIMAYSHFGHNCKVGNLVKVTNACSFSGHVFIQDEAVIGGMVGIHQNVTVGRLAMVGGFSKIVRDVPPFAMVDGRKQEIFGINAVGLRRAGINQESRSVLKKAFKILFHSDMILRNAIDAISSEMEAIPEVKELLEFLELTREGNKGRAKQAS